MDVNISNENSVINWAKMQGGCWCLYSNILISFDMLLTKSWECLYLYMKNNYTNLYHINLEPVWSIPSDCCTKQWRSTCALDIRPMIALSFCKSSLNQNNHFCIVCIDFQHSDQVTKKRALPSYTLTSERVWYAGALKFIYQRKAQLHVARLSIQSRPVDLSTSIGKSRC